MAEVTKNEQVRQRVANGAPFRVKDVSAAYNVHDPLVYTAKKEMTARGYRFESVNDESAHFRCVNPEHQPTPSQIELAASMRREAYSKRNEPRSKPKAQPKRSADTRMAQAEAVLISGQWMNFTDTAAQLGCSDPLISLAKRGLEKAGFRFEQRYVDGRSEWRCLNPRTSTRQLDPDQVQASMDRAIESVRRREERVQHAKQAVANGHTIALFNDPGPAVMGMPMDSDGLKARQPDSDGVVGTPLPFAGKVQVFAMSLKDDGTIRFGIQSETTRWFADVVGEVAR